MFFSKREWKRMQAYAKAQRVNLCDALEVCYAFRRMRRRVYGSKWNAVPEYSKEMRLIEVVSFIQTMIEARKK